MSSSSQSIEWNRLLIEGVVIVASILMAFAIEAWWDNRQSRNAEINQLHSVAAELKSNTDLVRAKLETLVVADAAAREMMSWMGPEPQHIEQNEFGETFRKMYAIGSLTLPREASEHFLAGVLADAIGDNDVRNAITKWRSESDALERQYSWLREAHTMLIDYLVDAAPMLNLDGLHPIMQDVQGSKFPFIPSDLLSDPGFESRMSHYLIRLRFVQNEAAELVERQPKLLELVQSAAES